jgi:methyl-accepting chemotaxis protein
MKLIMYFGVIALLVGVVGFMGYSGTSGVADSFDEISDETSPAILALGKIESSVHRIGVEAVSFTLIQAELGDAAAAAAELDELEEAKEQLEFWEDKFDEVAEDEEEKKFVEEIEEHEVSYYNAALALVNAKKEGKSGQEILDLRDKLGEEEEEFEELINKVIENEKNELEEQDEFADALAASTIRNITIVSIIAILLSIGLGLFVSQRITKPLTELSQTVDEVSKGNFKVDVPKTSSIKEINTLADSLDRVMTTMKFAVEEKGSVKIVKQEPEKLKEEPKKKFTDIFKIFKKKEKL